MLKVTCLLLLATAVFADSHCHRTCVTCNTEFSNSCTSCRSNNTLRAIHGNEGYCECNSGYRPEPDATNCVRNCHDSCETCSGTTEYDCDTCPAGTSLAAPAPNACISGSCHASCISCSGPEDYQCTSCPRNSELHSGYCLCSEGYYLSSDQQCLKPTISSSYHEFKFDKCGVNWISNGVTLEGLSTEKAAISFPQPVANRGVFFNNKTYFRVDGLAKLKTDFSMNAWIKSHDLGRATIFSMNSVNNEADKNATKEYQEDITSFSWRVANRCSDENSRRRDMVELKDWSSNGEQFYLQTEDPNYTPKEWSNIAYSVEYDDLVQMTTITMYSWEMDTFCVIAVASIDKKFALQAESTDIVGHRLTKDGDAGNEFFGFIYYLSFYTFATDDFSDALSPCWAPDSSCWVNEYLGDHNECSACSPNCQSCLNDGRTCYCPHIYP